VSLRERGVVAERLVTLTSNSVCERNAESTGDIKSWLTCLAGQLIVGKIYIAPYRNH
jgi:hypothetical protein